MAKGQVAFGHKHLAQQLAVRLKNHFSDKDASASLVIGIFGEWGSGKSNLLQLVRDEFDRKPVKKTGQVVVIPFNPWRYEKEQHLIVPLFKTMQQVLNRHIEDHKTQWEKWGVLPKLERAVEVVAKSALAFAKGFKGELTLGVGDDATGKIEAKVEVDLEKIADGVAQALEKPVEPKRTPIETLESYYYDFEAHLRELTVGKESFRLLFLIDDLDRCLPEKAVEMLESIKLFLDVEGCAFVLAVDDEVVERGIIHRYREYIFQGANGANADKPLAQMPITGTEYLEKIIQLPFRLFLPSKDEIRAFLRAVPAYADLFGKPAGQEGSEAHSSRAGGENEELLKLFSEHIPPVPRKQLRAADLLLLQLEMAKARGCAQRIKPLPLAKLIVLQLFAPDLYRFGRRHHQGFMRNLQEWQSTHADWERNIETFGKSLEASINELQDTQKEGELRQFDRRYKPLIEALEKAAQNRSGFNPFRLIRNMPFSDDELDQLPLYFSFVGENPVELAVSGIPPAAQFGQVKAGNVDPRPLVRPADVTDFLDLLFSPSPANWRSAVQLPEIIGGVLDNAIFSVVFERLNNNEFKGFLENRNWLGNLLPLLSSEQFNDIASKSNFSALLSVEQWTESATLLVAMRAEQRQAFAQSVGALQKVLLATARDDQQPIVIRARAGRLLGDSGWLPDDLDTMILINEGFFLCGDKKEKAQIDKDYWIGKYLVTNAQYRRFIDAKGYENRSLWSEKGWAWRDKKEIQFPCYWEDRKWANPLSPVVGVSYYEAEAYCCWSQSQMRANPAVFGLPADQAGALICRLPSNDEWERAARGQDGREYPWSGKFLATKANSGESWQSADNEESGTTAVNAFPQGESPAGLFDCAGNVWEWTSSTDEDGDPFIRGGAWGNAAEGLRCAFRNGSLPDLRLNFLGFRVVLSV